jgi:cobalt-zinc-cadmium efflux system protein
MSRESQNDRIHTHSSNRRRLTAVLALTFAYMLAEAIGGFATNSLALLSDAGHMLADVASLVLALLALWFAARPATAKKTYGYYRMEILAALANGSALVVISLLISYEAIRRIKSPEGVKGFEVMLIAIGGLAVNVVSAFVLHSASEQNLNMRGAFLHVMGDALGSAGAIVAGITVWQWGWVLADPLISVAMCLLIIYSSWRLIRESVNILLEGTPSHINVRAVAATMHQVAGVTDVHDLHVWTISSGLEALSAHVTIEPGVSHRGVLEALQERLRSEFNIGHVTIQIVSPDEADAPGGKLYQILHKG